MRRLAVLTLGLAIVTSGHVALAEDAPADPTSEISTSVPATVATPEQPAPTAPPGTTPVTTDGATVTTDGDATVFVIDQRSFMAVLDDVPALSHKLLAALAGRIRDFDRQYYG